METIIPAPLTLQAIDLELKILLEQDVALFKAARQALQTINVNVLPN